MRSQVKRMQAVLTNNDDLETQNDRHLYLDILWWGILGGTFISFLGIYLARLGATSFQLSILTAGPAVVNLLISLPIGKFLETRSFARTAYYASILHRVGYVVILLVMLIFVAQLQISLTLWITVVMSIPGAALMIAFNAMFADIVPPRRRGLVVGRRNALLAVSMTTSALIAGQLLEHIMFPLNYQIVFFIIWSVAMPIRSHKPVYPNINIFVLRTGGPDLTVKFY